MSEHEKAVIRSALMLHAVIVLAGHNGGRQAVAELQRACRRLLKKHPKRAYRRKRKP